MDIFGALTVHTDLNDPGYQHDITEAGKRAQQMRRGGSLARVLWLLNEKASWQLEIGAEILTELRSDEGKISQRLDAIIQKLDEGVTVDLGPTNALLQAILDLLKLEEPGEIGPAVNGVFYLNGVASNSAGESNMNTVKDSDGPGKISLDWTDAKGAVQTNVNDEAWSSDNPDVFAVTQDASDTTGETADYVIGVPGTATVTVRGTNPDGTEAVASDSVVVEAGDAVGGTFTLTPNP